MNYMKGFLQVEASGRTWTKVAFLRKIRDASFMDEAEKTEHARLLREAIERSGHSRQAIADALGKSVRNVGYWTSRKSPTMPDAGDRETLRKLLGPYDVPGDAVEAAIRRSELQPWRQSDVIATYQRHLHEQAHDKAV